MKWFNKLLSNTQFERYFLFFINVYIFFVYGMLSGSFGITLGQFGNVLKLNTQDLSLGLSAQAIFGCIASLLATYTLDRFNRDLQYALDVFLLSLIIILFPFSNTYGQYLTYSAAIGFFTSVINCVNTIWVLELFRDNPSFFIQILFFFYPLGATFSRFLFSPFLDDSQLASNSTNASLVNGTELSIDANSTSPISFVDFFTSLFDNVEKTNIWIPYLAVGVLMMLGSFMIFFVVIFNPFEKAEKSKVGDDDGEKRKESAKSKESNANNVSQQEEQMPADPKKRSRKQQILSVVFVVLTCIIVTLQVGCEINFVNFVPTFLTRLSSFDFNDTQASYISIILTGMVTFGRFVNIFLSLKIETEFMSPRPPTLSAVFGFARFFSFLNFFLMLAGNLILVFLSGTSVELIWTGIGLIGLGFSSTYPLIIAFVEKRYLMTNALSSLLEFSCLFFVCFSPIAFGHVLDQRPGVFIYIYLFANLLIMVLFSFLHFLGNFRKV